jgi:hypothetical protein
MVSHGCSSKDINPFSLAHNIIVVKSRKLR